MKIEHIVLALALGLPASGQEPEGVSFGSPGLPDSRMDAQGRLVEDWGMLGLRLEGEGLDAAGPVEVARIELDELIPAARAAWRSGPVGISLTAWRAPVWPGGVDVLTARLFHPEGEAVQFELVLDLPEGVRVGERTATLGGRTVLAFPSRPQLSQELREWGHCDEATDLPGWARPEPGFDPAFANIRAGLGGVPILYRFAVEPAETVEVVLGFCESHWSAPGSRTLTCKVEGSPAEEVDPLARWGRHRPGGVLLEGRDGDGDGRVDVLVLGAPDSPDENPILNALWLFEPGRELDVEQVVAGRLNALARRYVDVGGERDQSIRPPGKLSFPVALKAGGELELSFLAACPGGSAPRPEESAWTPVSLRRAAREVWKDWKEE